LSQHLADDMSKLLEQAARDGIRYLEGIRDRRVGPTPADLERRRARGIKVWAALRTLGRSGLAELIDRTCAHARRFAEELRAAGFEVLNDVVINQVLVSFGAPERTQRKIAAIQADGTCWCGGTMWKGAPAMRISVSSWATTEEDVERSLEAMIRCAKQATG
jgi:glutamate/tyrosine decarboxylase-like PLP-dependent enzyme